MRSIGELKARRTVCDMLIRGMLNDREMQADPRYPDALAHYRAQLKKLDRELTDAEKAYRQANGIPEPEPVVIGLQPARMFGKADR